MFDNLESTVLNLQGNTFIQNSAIAGIIVITGIIGAHFFSRFVGLCLLKLGLLEKLKQKGIKNPAWILEAGIRYLIYAVAFYYALMRLGLFETFFSILALVIGTIIIIVIILEFKDFIVNTISGLIVYSRHSYKIGDTIKIGDLEGEVKEISITETKIVTARKDLIVIPNYFIVKSKVKIKEPEKKTDEALEHGSSSV